MIDRLHRIRENCETIARDLYGVTPPVSALAGEVAKLAEAMETSIHMWTRIADGQILADYIESETRLASIIEADPGRDPDLPAEDGA